MNAAEAPDERRWFAAWAVVGAVGTLGLVSLPPLLLPAALAAVLLARHRARRGGAWGALSGAGAVLLYVAYVQRQGPGEDCHPIGTAPYRGIQCDQHLDPRPWLVVGVMLVIAGIVGVVVRRRRRGR